MRKYGCSKRNPDPKWPCEQAVVVVPPGSSVATAAKINNSLKSFENLATEGSKQLQNPEVIHNRDERIPIMGYMNESSRRNENTLDTIIKENCSRMDVATYLCQNKGNYTRIEFMFGENMHVEKTGILENVGKDFVVLTEAGTGTQVVSAMKNIKFIHLYKINNR